MEVDVEVEGGPKALDECHGTRTGNRKPSEAGATSMKSLEGAQPDGNHLCRESRITGPCEADVPGKREHPLPDGKSRKKFFD